MNNDEIKDRRIRSLERHVGHLEIELEAAEEEIERLRNTKPKKAKRVILQAAGDLSAKKMLIASLRKPCQDCGNADLRLIEFHHRDPATKLGSVSEMMKGGWTADMILAEVAKCDCLCRNCHRLRHIGS